MQMAHFTGRASGEWSGDCCLVLALCSEHRDQERREEHLAATSSLGAGVNWALPWADCVSSSWGKLVLNSEWEVFFTQEEQVGKGFAQPRKGPQEEERVYPVSGPDRDGRLS